DKNENVQKTLVDVSSKDQRRSDATAVEDVDRVQDGRRKSREVLQAFEKLRYKAKRRRLRNKKTLSRLPAAERRQVQNHARGKKQQQ
ncbi:hypothetical protein BGZ65_003324, partial [Modicella reniformis]